MILALILILMVIATVGLLLMPLVRPTKTLPQRLDYDLAIFRDQVAEVDLDIERGLLTAKQAEAARDEIYRRALIAEKEFKPMRPKAFKRTRFAAACMIALVVPLGAATIYGYVGSPELPALPYAERQQQVDPVADFMSMPTADENAMIHAMVDRLAERMQSTPNDIDGWERLEKSYSVLGDDAKAKAIAKKIKALKAKKHD